MLRLPTRDNFLNKSGQDMTAITILLIIIAVGVGYLIFKQKEKEESPKQTNKKPYSKTDLRIENIAKGGVLKLTSVGPNMEDFDIQIVSKHTYRQGESTWYELEGNRGDGKVWIDMEEDDELELTIVHKKLKIRDLPITMNDLEKFDDEEEGSFEYDGDTFHYEDSDEAIFYRHSDDKNAEKFYYWDFETDDGSKFISFEKWSNNSIDVSFSFPIKPRQVEVFSLGES